MIRFAVIGTGWRTHFFMRIAQARPDLFELCGIMTRDIERARQWMHPYQVPLFTSLDDLLAQKPLFVVTSVPWGVNPGMLRELAERGIPALSETPPATSIEEMNDLYELVRKGAKIAVAEQYHLQPEHAARIAFAHSGKLGSVTQAQVSVAHGYHGISLIRRLLGIGFEDVRIDAKRFYSPIIKSPDRLGAPDQEEIVRSQQVVATLEFGDKLGVFDFSDDQYFSYIRGKRVMVRGERGEIIDDRAVYLEDQRTPIHVDFKRYTAGEHGNLEGWYLKGIQVGTEWIYRNPLAPAAFADDEIAVGHCLLKMAEYADGGEAFYSLAEACQDRYLDILIWQSVERGQPVQSQRQRWAE
jgi:predicted dehydrogenase